MSSRPKFGSTVAAALYVGATQPGELYTSFPSAVVTEIDRIESIESP